MKKFIDIGIGPDGKPATFDIAKLIKTRLLLCANSGGGKSYLLRRIAEQLFGIMPTIIFDVEGEFVTLREKFDFVLVGPGGETPADCRSAKLVIEKLLELRASAVIDLSELEVLERHRYVKLAAEAAINSRKELWRPTCFIFDEAHEFCPENGKGHSEAKSAVLAFPTKGRKRQFLSIFATQRLHKLAFDARAEMLNRMIGMTFEPDDLKVAAEILGVAGGDDRKAFARQMRTMTEGQFFTFGRAISLETVLVKVGPVQTTHGIEESKTFHAPPTPERIKALLPKLADLPQQAEEKAKTEAELRAEIKRLSGELRAAKTAMPAPQQVSIEIPLLKDSDLKLIHYTADKFDLIVAETEKMTGQARECYKYLNGLIGALETARRFQPMHGKPAPPPKIDQQRVEARIAAPQPGPAAEITPGQDGPLRGGELEILKAIAQFGEGVTAEQITVLTQYRATSRKEYLRKLTNRGLIWREGEIIRANTSGIAALGDNFKPLPVGPELVDHYRVKLIGGELKIFEYAVATGSFQNDEALEQATGYKQTSRKEFIRQLRARHILVEQARGVYTLAKEFFL